MTGAAMRESAGTAIVRRAAVRSQSLADGAIGDVLLAVERAHGGRYSWRDVHAALSAAIRRQPLIVTDQASLFFGAPAVAFVVHLAAGGSGGYRAALSALDVQVRAVSARRLRVAHARIDRGERPLAGEFDLFYGLTGLGAYYLCRDADSPVLRDILAYLVRLTMPLPGDPDRLPGWWTACDPAGRVSSEFSGGHGNLGIAHGIAGPLALLAMAALSGCTVEGHAEAITRICAWVDAWRQHTGAGSWWPYWVTLDEQRTGVLTKAVPGRPSWCYGTPGQARAQQLAGLALGDLARQRMAERALQACLSNPSQLGLITGSGLCHGAAGLLHVTRRVAGDAPAGTFARQLPALRDLMWRLPRPSQGGLLEGTAGVDLVALAGQAESMSAPGWDTCLLLSPVARPR